MFFCYFERESHYEAQAGLEFDMLLKMALNL